MLGAGLFPASVKFPNLGREVMMRFALAVLFLGLSAGASQAACSGPIGNRPTKSGGTMQVCLEPKYSTCISNNLKGGWTKQEATTRCEGLRAQGKVK